ncbi:hypothetical protein ACFQ1M_08440 [Sungkyunkwania multivorans]|uniref:Uncharacterized protein n=1 Tax=Sungkyunkwania multivorans TaxID=1173618 RepID=A0ABW3CWU6_9FLAO
MSWPRAKIRAGALQFSVFVGVVVSLILGAFIMLIHIHRTLSVRSDLFLETIRNADTGIQYSLNHEINDSISLPIFEEDYKHLIVSQKQWGAFKIVSSKSTIKQYTFEKVAMVGGWEMKRPALFLKDENRALILVGQTRVEGGAYLPKRGVRSGNISGNSYYGSRLIYGNTRESSEELPSILPVITDSGAQLNSAIPFEQSMQLKNSFLKETTYIYQAAPINLFDANLTGNIIVISNSKITVHPEAKLTDVILMAPKIEVKNNVVGRFQAIATKNIEIGKDSQLRYPSALVVKERISQNIQADQPTEINQIVLQERSRVEGVIIYEGQPKTRNYEPQVVLKINAKVKGEIHCNQNLELLGTVEGSVYTAGFIAKQSGSVYQNHIYNGKILEPALPEEYAGLLFENSKKAVAQWLY